MVTVQTNKDEMIVKLILVLKQILLLGIQILAFLNKQVLEYLLAYSS